MFDTKVQTSANVYAARLAENDPVLHPTLLRTMAQEPKLRSLGFEQAVIDQFTRAQGDSKKLALEILTQVPIESWLVDEELTRITKADHSTLELKALANAAIQFRKDSHVYHPPIQVTAPSGFTPIQPSLERTLRRLALSYRSTLEDNTDQGPSLTLRLFTGKEEDKQSFLAKVQQRIFNVDAKVAAEVPTIDMRQIRDREGLHNALLQQSPLQHKTIVLDNFDAIQDIPDVVTQSNVVEYLKRLTGHEFPIEGLDLKHSVFVLKGQQVPREDSNPAMPALISRINAYGTSINL